MILEVRQTWQFAGGTPRMIEASIELTDDFDSIRPRGFPRRFFEPEVARIVVDESRAGHFEGFGGGHRRGWVWVDRAAGLGSARGWSAAYTVRPTPERDRGLDDELVEALKEFVGRF